MTRRNTDRNRPELALGGTFDALSFPQHDVNNEPSAVQKHHVKDIPTQETTCPCIINIVGWF